MKILIIEDDNQTRDYVSAGLKETGHNVDSAKDGHEGLLLAKEMSYDLLIVDRMLPRLDGLTLVKNLRGDNLQVPVLFLTTMCGIDDRVEGLNADADDYLVKPFAFSELIFRAGRGLQPRPERLQPSRARKRGGNGTLRFIQSGSFFCLRRRGFKCNFRFNPLAPEHQ